MLTVDGKNSCKATNSNTTNSNTTNSCYVERACEYVGSIKVNTLHGVNYKHYIHDQVHNSFKNIRFGLRVLLVVTEKSVKTLRHSVEKMSHCMVNVSFASYLNKPKLFVYVAKGYLNANDEVRTTQAHVYKMEHTKHSKQLGSVLQSCMDKLAKTKNNDTNKDQVKNNNTLVEKRTKKKEIPRREVYDVADHIVHDAEEDECVRLVRHSIVHGEIESNLHHSTVHEEIESNLHHSTVHEGIDSNLHHCTVHEEIDSKFKIINEYYDLEELQKKVSYEWEEEYVIVDMTDMNVQQHANQPCNGEVLFNVRFDNEDSRTKSELCKGLFIYVWYEPSLSTNEAHALLQDKAIGSFYLRNGPSSSKPYVLTLKYQHTGRAENDINDYMVFYDHVMYRLEGSLPTFRTILDLVHYYTAQSTDKDQPDNRYTLVLDQSGDANIRNESCTGLMRELHIYRTQYFLFVLCFSHLLNYVL